MRWSRILLPGLVLLPACGGSTGPSTPRYQVTVAQSAVRTGDGGAYLRDVTVHVTTAGAAAARVGVAVQSTAGSVAPLPLITSANGDAELTWTIPAGQQVPGSTHSLGFCAHDVGSSCSIDLNGAEVVRASF